MASGAWLDRVERAGNRLSDPATLFLAGTLVVMLLSRRAVSLVRGLLLGVWVAAG